MVSHLSISYVPISALSEISISTAIAIRLFLDNSQTQLTYHGLFTLSSMLSPGSLVALFRSSHLAVLYKSPEDSSLYTLVSDAVFLRESSVVWERLEDIDGGWSTFVDGEFVKSSPAGGDFAGETAESAMRAFEAETGQFSEVDSGEYVLRSILLITVIEPNDMYLHSSVKPSHVNYKRRKMRMLNSFMRKDRGNTRRSNGNYSCKRGRGEGGSEMFLRGERRRRIKISVLLCRISRSWKCGGHWSIPIDVYREFDFRWS